MNAYEEPNIIVLNNLGSSWQGTARNGGFFVVGDFAMTREEAMRSCLEKYQAEINKKRPKVSKPAPKPAYDPIDSILEDI